MAGLARAMVVRFLTVTTRVVYVFVIAARAGRFRFIAADAPNESPRTGKFSYFPQMRGFASIMSRLADLWFCLALPCCGVGGIVSAQIGD